MCIYIYYIEYSWWSELLGGCHTQVYLFENHSWQHVSTMVVLTSNGFLQKKLLMCKGFGKLHVSKNNGKPSNHPFVHRVFHYKPSILGYPYFWKHPIVGSLMLQDPLISSCLWRKPWWIQGSSSSRSSREKWRSGMMVWPSWEGLVREVGWSIFLWKECLFWMLFVSCVLCSLLKNAQLMSLE